MPIQKIMLFGDVNSGKSALLQQARGGEFNNAYEPTYVVDLILLNLPEFYESKLNIWDLSGDGKYKTITNTYFRGTSVLLYCVDLSKPLNNEEITQAITQAKNDSPKAQVILIGTKSDLVEEESITNLKKFAEENHFDTPYITSAKNNKNIRELFNEILFLPVIKEAASDKALKNALVNLKESMKSSSFEETTKISSFSYDLLTTLNNPSITREKKLQAITHYQKSCNVVTNPKMTNYQTVHEAVNQVFMVLKAISVTLSTSIENLQTSPPSQAVSSGISAGSAFFKEYRDRLRDSKTPDNVKDAVDKAKNILSPK